VGEGAGRVKLHKFGATPLHGIFHCPTQPHKLVVLPLRLVVLFPPRRLAHSRNPCPFESASAQHLLNMCHMLSFRYPGVILDPSPIIKRGSMTCRKCRNRDGQRAYECGMEKHVRTPMRVTMVVPIGVPTAVSRPMCAPIGGPTGDRVSMSRRVSQFAPPPPLSPGGWSCMINFQFWLKGMSVTGCNDLPENSSPMRLNALA
jgi:hypothetical protein